MKSTSLYKTLPMDIVMIILQYDGRIKYRNGEFVNVIHPNLLKMYSALLVPLFMILEK